MAFPTILIDSATGSDTQASGAGPSTALFGTGDAVSAADGLSVIVTALLDISGVATDGSAVFYFADTTAGNRNFAKITGSSGSGGATPTFTLANALGFTLTKNWAVGGKRASIGSTTSLKLCSNNGTSGDMLPGWIIELQSGHSETIDAQYECRRAGDTTTGPITIRGASGAGTLPLITFSNNGIGFVTRADYWHFRNFEIRNSNASKTASEAFWSGGTSLILIDGVKVSHSTNKFWKGIPGGGGVFTIVNCEVGYTASDAIHAMSQGSKVINCFIHDAGGVGISINSTDPIGCQISGNVIYNCTSHGILFDATGNSSNNRSVSICGNTIANNGGDGLRSTLATQAIGDTCYENNIFANNGGYGMNFTSGSVSLAFFTAYATQFRGTQAYNNTSGACNVAGLLLDDLNLNPSFTNASGGDFSIGTALKAKGYPLGGTMLVGTYSSTYSYVDPGAAQRQESGGGGSALHLGSLGQTGIGSF